MTTEDASPAGRLGLALSGGGFRASFYHVGTLARLSDAGILPRVEVVSSVSGGSITAAVYGLHLRRLLEQDHADAHAEAVRATWETLRSGVRHNLRGMLFANVWHTLRLLGPHCEHRLFLSATPHNGYTESFTALLELLDPQRFARGVLPRPPA